MMPDSGNFFLAVQVPDAVREVLHQRAHALQSAFTFKSWVRSTDYHITLVFLGKIGSGKTDRLEQKLAPVIARHDAFRLAIDHIGTFGKKSQPRVLWAGVSAGEQMAALQQDIYEACTNLGFELDARPFHAHITLARKWNGNDRLDPSDLEKAGDFQEKNTSWTADEIVLFESHPRRKPRYRVVQRFPLAGE